MSGRVTDDGLSEVIGFILIIAIIVILGSLYMTYVVPSQGRDAEIQHMQNVEKFFTDFKMNIDALWYNNQIGVSFNQILYLGTGGQTSAGAFSIFPIMQPVSSSGRVSISEYPKIILSIDGVFSNITSEGSVGSEDEYLAIFADYSTNVYPDDFPPYDPHTLTIWSGGSNISMVNPLELVNWIAILEVKNATLRQDDLKNVLNWTEHPETREVSHFEILNYPVKEVTISVVKNGNKTLEDEVIYRGLIAEGSWNETIPINLMEEAYGLSDERISNLNLNYQYTNSAGSTITKNSPIQYCYPNGSCSNTPNLNINERVVTTEPIRIGTFNYSSRNPYWINQEYIYQFGEVQLKQGNVIQSKINSNWIQGTGTGGTVTNLDINLISLYGDSTVASQDAVQIDTNIVDIRENILYDGSSWYKLMDDFYQNAESFSITIETSSNEQARYWYDSLNETLNRIGLSNLESPPTGNIARIRNSTDLHVNLKQINVQMGIDTRVDV
jgi:hypothetical protein